MHFAFIFVRTLLSHPSHMKAFYKPLSPDLSLAWGEGLILQMVLCADSQTISMMDVCHFNVKLKTCFGFMLGLQVSGYLRVSMCSQWVCGYLMAESKLFWRILSVQVRKALNSFSLIEKARIWTTNLLDVPPLPSEPLLADIWNILL